MTRPEWRTRPEMMTLINLKQFLHLLLTQIHNPKILLNSMQFDALHQNRRARPIHLQADEDVRWVHAVRVRDAFDDWVREEGRVV